MSKFVKRSVKRFVKRSNKNVETDYELLNNRLEMARAQRRKTPKMDTLIGFRPEVSEFIQFEAARKIIRLNKSDFLREALLVYYEHLKSCGKLPDAVLRETIIELEQLSLEELIQKSKES